MLCAWESLLELLPQWMRRETDRLGRESATELRLRLGQAPEIVMGEKSCALGQTVEETDIRFCLNVATQYSPWAAGTGAQGYLSLPGGHRMGLCGDMVVQNGKPTGFREVRSLCIRVARDFPGIGSRASPSWGSVLILGPPGWGKTTLLRDIVRTLACTNAVSVVDERGELFPPGFQTGRHTDILRYCGKTQGIDMVLRAMGPSYIAADEITAPEDCCAMLQAQGCGVKLLATAHAFDAADLKSRIVYRPLLENKVFQTLIQLHRDKSYTVERMTL